MEKLKAFLASPEGAAAIVGLIRAFFTVAIGLGVALTQSQANNAITLATSLIVITNLVLSGFTVKTVQARSNQEEIDAAVSGKVLQDNNTTASPNA